MDQFWRGVLWTFVTIFLIACAVGSYVLAVTAGTVEGRDRVVALAYGGGLLVPPLLVQAIREARSRNRLKAAEALALEYEARLLVALGSTVAPLGDLCARIATSTGREKTLLRGQLEQRIVTAAAQLCGPDNETRAVFFQLNGNEMHSIAHAGRPDPPTTVFIDGQDSKGTNAHALVRSQGYVFVEDVENERRLGLRVRSDATYKTYMAVAVFAGNRPLGMLAVDALRPGSIESGSVAAARALAQLLAIGLL